MSIPLLQIRNVSKKFGSFQALNNVTCDIFEGEIFALLGANGAGKTTLSSIIASLHKPTEGQILYKSTSIFDNTIKYRRLLGYCPQKPNFSGKFSVQEHLELAGNVYGLNKTYINQRIEQLAHQFNFSRYLHSSAEILSGGYKQRLLLARALLHHPEIIILDEPTVALDPHIRRQLWDCIRSLKGCTVILTTHYIEEAEILADRICILEKGAIKLIDTPKNLLAQYQKQSLEDVFIDLIDE